MKRRSFLAVLAACVAAPAAALRPQEPVWTVWRTRSGEYWYDWERYRGAVLPARLVDLQRTYNRLNSMHADTVSLRVGDVFTIAGRYRINPRTRRPTGELMTWTVVDGS